jgi:hypothetical protein
MKTTAWSSLYLLILMACSSCQKEIAPIDPVEEKEPHVYLAGTFWDEVNKKYKAFLLKDEALSFLNNSDESASALSMAVQGEDIYLSGYLKKPSDKAEIACYWKNGTRTDIDTDRDFGSTATSITVSNNTVYTCGWQNGSAVYRKNGTSYTAARSPSGRDTYKSIFVNNNDVYIGGYYTSPVNFKSVPTYWKNDVLVQLPVPMGHLGVVEDVAVKGTDVYAIGYTLEADGKKEVATYWKNGNAVKLSDGSVSTKIECIAIAGDDIYMAGTNNLKTLVCWKNDKIIFTDLTTAQESSYPLDIFIFKNDVYIAGSLYINNTNNKPVYWKNGERHIINNTALAGGTGYGIAVLP